MNVQSEAAPQTPPPQDVRYLADAAGYVATMLAELRQIAAKAGLDQLVHALDAAYYEAYGARDRRGREAVPPPANLAAEKNRNTMEQNAP